MPRWVLHRRAALLAVVVAVVAIHAALLLAPAVTTLFAAPKPMRVDVSLMTELVPSVPKQAGSSAQAAPDQSSFAPRGALRWPKAAASATSIPRQKPASAAALARLPRQEDEAEASRTGTSPLAGADEPALDSPSAEADTSAATAASASAHADTVGRGALTASSDETNAPPGPALDWPPSTRLIYTLTGLYRNGALYGNATVDWRREGRHYQVEFNIHISPFFDQRMFSDGSIEEDGLHPRRYDETREFLLAPRRSRHIEFGEREVKLANGQEVARLPQSQDPASQFVQFVWIFSTDPARLKAGRQIDIALALPASLRRWRYDVGAMEILSLPFGDLHAIHLRPHSAIRQPNEYPFEIWTAPTLQYLPVRIRVQLDEQNFADLRLERLPLQAHPAVPASAAASRTQAPVNSPPMHGDF